MLKLLKSHAMKNLYFLLMGLFLLTSCEITEDVYVESNGHITYTSHIDMTQLILMMPEDQMDSKDFPIDSIFTVEGLSESKNGMVDGFEDEIERELMKAFKFHVKANKNQAFMKMMLEKKSLAEFNQFMHNLQTKIEEVNRERKKANKDLADTMQKEMLDIPIYSTPILNLTKEKFKRTGSLKNLEKLLEDDKDLGSMEGMGEMLRYTLNYHFDKPIKSVSDPSAVISIDKRSVKISKPASVSKEDPKAFDFEVIFE